MKDHLTVVDRGDDRYHIAWYLVEEQDYGAYLGEVEADEEEPNRSKDLDSWESWMAHRIALEDPNHEHDDMGCYWERKSDATAVIKRINAAFKGKRPLESWEIKALEAGWKPPKKRK